MKDNGSSEDAARALMAPYLEAMRHDLGPARLALDKAAGGAVFRMCHPFGDLDGAAAFWDGCVVPLAEALPDLERVEYIRIAGVDEDGAMWVGSGGYYSGTWINPFLGIRATGHAAVMRFHEFYRIEEGVCVEVQTIWDIPEMMMQAGVWPLAPQLGRLLHVPGPQTCDGLGPHDAAYSLAARRFVIDMLKTMGRHPAEGGPDVMEMPRFWHPKMMWYGPAGIGTTRGIDGFRRHHQISFLGAMPDRGAFPHETKHHFMAEGDYVGVTGWPNMKQTLAKPGWLGIAPPGKAVTMRSLDFWRLENGLIRENWVLVDLLDVYAQIGVDVFERMRELMGQPR